MCKFSIVIILAFAVLLAPSVYLSTQVIDLQHKVTAIEACLDNTAGYPDRSMLWQCLDDYRESR